MIERITNPEKFEKAVNNIFDSLDIDSEENPYYQIIPNDRQSFIKAYSHKGLLAQNVFAWGNLNNLGEYDAGILFVRQPDAKLNKVFFTEQVWLSNNPKVGFKLMATALEFARNQGFEYIRMGAAVKSPAYEKVKKFYKKMGFLLEAESYIAKL
jgi:hypothetical protein